jgi:TM2 domain-containing membrane protein YozV
VLTITRRKKIIAVIMSIVIWGLGHAYIGRVKRGIGIFLLGLAVTFSISFLIPFPFSIPVILIYLVWLIYDLLRIIDATNKQSQSSEIGSLDSESKPQQISCSKCGNINTEDSAFCVKCGSALK